MNNPFYFQDGVIIVSDAVTGGYILELRGKFSVDMNSLSNLELEVLVGVIGADFAMALNKRFKNFNIGEA